MSETGGRATSRSPSRASAWNVFGLLLVAIALVPATGPLSIRRALPRIGCVVLLVGMVFYVCALMGTEPFGADHREHFAIRGRTLYSLLQVTTLESWSESIARPTMADHPWAALYFVVFIVITALTVLNLFIGVIVSTLQEAVQADETRQREQAEAQAQQERAEMLHLIRRLDERLAYLDGERLDPGEAGTQERG